MPGKYNFHFKECNVNTKPLSIQGVHRFIAQPCPGLLPVSAYNKYWGMTATADFTSFPNSCFVAAPDYEQKYFPLLTSFVKDLEDGFVRHRPTARLRQSASMGASTSYNEVIPPPLPPPPVGLTQGRRVDTSLRRLERTHDDLFQL